MEPIGMLLLGESGSGKSYSTKPLPEEETKILSVMKPILPYRKKVDITYTPTADDIIREMKKTSKKIIVVDDFQYILGIPMMKRIGEKGWDKFSEIEQGYSDVLDAVHDLPKDTIVIFTSHTETTDEGKTKIKTIGKALDKYITIEGLFMIVLGTKVVDGKYYFVTQSDGANTLKSPEGMFPSRYIPNDLAYVVDKIRNYYYFDGAKTDDEIAAEDAEHKVSDEEIKPKRRHKSDEDSDSKDSKEEKPRRRYKASEKADEKIAEEKKESEEEMEGISDVLDKTEGEEADFNEVMDKLPKRKDRGSETETQVEENSSENTETSGTEEKPVRRRRRRA